MGYLIRMESQLSDACYYSKYFSPSEWNKNAEELLHLKIFSPRQMGVLEGEYNLIH